MLKKLSMLLIVVMAMTTFCINGFASGAYTQIVTPNPDIPCKPGWCLAYVKDAFGARAVSPDATSGWNNTQYKHFDKDFPSGCYVPLWFAVAGEPRGHVVFRGPNGEIYSASSATSHRPMVHKNLEALMAYYAASAPLTYLGWSEDLEGMRVVQPSGGEGMVITLNDGTYAIKNLSTGLSLNVYANGLPVSGQELTVYPFDRNDTCMWFIVEKRSQWFLIRTMSQNVVLNVYNEGTAVNGDNVNVLRAYPNDKTQLWMIENVGNSAFVIRSAVNKDLCLAPSGTYKNMTDVRVVRYDGSASQKWTFEKL